MKHFSSKDRVFAKPLASIKAFEFDESVTQVFDDMIHRSVPGYDLLVRLIALYADIFVDEDSVVYDLGCSTGVVSRVVAQKTQDRLRKIVAIDNSPSMINACQERHQELEQVIDWRCDDIQNVEINNASMVVLNLTLQFIDPDQRETLLQCIFEGLNPGGVLVLSEKVQFKLDREQTTATELYQAFKKQQGYSELEISQKRSALENVLIPDDPSTHLKRLESVGFNEVYECFRCLNFMSLLAIKS